MADPDLAEELRAAAAGREDHLGDLLAAAAARIDGQAEEIERLRQTEQRYHWLLENAVEGIYRTDPDSRQYERANGSMASILGYDSVESLLAAVEDVRTDVFVDPERFDEYESRLRANDRIEGFEYRVRRADGEVRWVADDAGVYYEDGSPAGYRGGVVDVTERKEFEDRLESRTSELEALNRVLRHDVANDMQVVRGYARHLEENVAEEYRPQAERIVTTADHTLEVTGDARAVLEAVTSQDDLQREPIALAELLTYVLESQREAHPEADYRVDGDLPHVEVRADGMLRSVFRNVLSNAVNHSDRDEPGITVSVRRDDEAVELRFADDGPGVPDDRKEAIFREGEQSEDSDGTGMGLYLVAELVDNYGGEVHVEDRPDGERGAVFVIRLPVAR